MIFTRTERGPSKRRSSPLPLRQIRPRPSHRGRFTLLSKDPNHYNSLNTCSISWRHYPYHDVTTLIVTSLPLSWRHYPYRDVTTLIMTSLPLSWRHYPYHDVTPHHVTSYFISRRRSLDIPRAMIRRLFAFMCYTCTFYFHTRTRTYILNNLINVATKRKTCWWIVYRLVIRV